MVTDANQRFTFIDTAMAGSHHDMSVFDRRSVTMTGWGVTSSWATVGMYNTTSYYCGFTIADQNQKKIELTSTGISSPLALLFLMLTLIILFFNFRCLDKNGSGVVQMEPLEASWLIRACVVLHNMCIDWGLQALKPEDSYDPEIKLDIQQEVAKQFLRSLKQNRDRSVVEVRSRKRDREEYLAGVRRRNHILHH